MTSRRAFLFSAATLAIAPEVSAQLSRPKRVAGKVEIKPYEPPPMLTQEGVQADLERTIRQDNRYVFVHRYIKTPQTLPVDQTDGMKKLKIAAQQAANFTGKDALILQVENGVAPFRPRVIPGYVAAVEFPVTQMYKDGQPRGAVHALTTPQEQLNIMLKAVMDAFVNIPVAGPRREY
ncbi:MAG: hypothetical protein IT558_04140 [Alphaproteobacteria bacterium]|nr:hypothetical protein [Alphaproteobacteria bacterium]